MAVLRLERDELVLHLSWPERIAALHGDIRVPASAVTAVEVVERPLASVAGVRAPGLAIPRRTKVGTWRGGGGRRFVVVRRGQPAVRVRLEGQRHRELLVSVPDAGAVASRLQAVAAGA